MEEILITVNTNKELKTFIKSQFNFYKNDKNFVPPLIFDRLKLLNTNKNPFFKHSSIKMFMLEKKGEIVGRIAAIINKNHNLTHNDKVGFFGFFECEDNQQTANLLLDAAKTYLYQEGMEQMRGPVNPSMNDECGLLVDGFNSPPVILMTYNPPYYAKLIENFGMQKIKDLFAYHLVNEKYISEKLERMQNIIRQRNSLTIRSVNFSDKKQFKKDVETLKYIYNNAWEPNWGFVKMTDEEFEYLANDLKSIADPEYTLIAEINGKPAGFALALPDINQCLIHNKNGHLLTGIWHLLTKKKKINLLRIIVLGILPQYQRTGADAVLYWELGTRGKPKGIEFGEASWILEDNDMMNKGLTTTMLGNVYKTYRLYQQNI